jgi:signal transduction histidine kinase
MTRRRPRRSFPLALRLAALYGLLVAATLVLVAGVTLAIARSHLERSLNAQLLSSAQSFRDGPGARARDAARLRVETRRWLAEHPLPQGQMAAIRIGGGDVLTSTGGLDLFEVAHQRELLAAPQPRWWNAHGTEGAVRGLTVPIIADGHQLGTVLLLAYERPMRRMLGALLSGIALASALGLSLALLLGIVAVRRSLRPLSRMTAEVSAIETTGDLTRRVALGDDEDEVGRLASAFDRMVGRLDEAFRSQRRFLADAAHELRTPLTVLRGQLELIADELEGDQRASFAVATDELERMARIIDDLLLLTRLDEGMELRHEPVEIELVLREALLRAMLIAPRDVRVETQPDLYALADHDRLLQVLTNLLTNAVQYTDESGRILLTSERRNGDVLLQVSDSGRGIAADEVPHVFERLYRGRTAQATAPQGSGLGLAIVASITQALNGTIDVDSALGRGTTFTITLPLGDPRLPQRVKGTTRSPNELAAATTPRSTMSTGWNRAGPSARS